MKFFNKNKAFFFKLFFIITFFTQLMHAMEVDDDFSSSIASRRSAFAPLMHDSAMQQDNQGPFARQRSNALTPHDFDRMPRATSQESGFDSVNHLNERPESVFLNLEDEENNTYKINEFDIDNQTAAVNRRPSTSFECMMHQQKLETKPEKRKRRHNNSFESNSDEEFEDDQNPKRFQ